MKLKNILSSLTLVGTLSLLSVTASVQAGEVEVTFDESKRYTDIRPAQNRSRKHFKDEIFKKLTGYFVKYGEALPEGQQLDITVTNIDLAGEVLLTGTQETRIIKDAYFPRLVFSYELKDASGAQLISGDANIKDMQFLRRLQNQRNTGKDLVAEKYLIETWYKDTFDL